MTGRIVARLGAPHKCAPGLVEGESGTWVPRSALVGDVWECGDCGTLWRAIPPPRVHRGTQSVQPEWQRMTRREEKRLRRNGKL